MLIAQRMTYDDLMALPGAQLVRQLYPRTRSAWIYRADGTINAINAMPADGTLDGEAVLPDFSISLMELFD